MLDEGEDPFAFPTADIGLGPSAPPGSLKCFNDTPSSKIDHVTPNYFVVFKMVVPAPYLIVGNRALSMMMKRSNVIIYI